MINCPKCQVPNQDNATVCAACGATLAGQQFAAALDQAQQQMGQAQAAPDAAPEPAPQTPPAAAPAPEVQPAMGVQPGFGAPPPVGQVGSPMDPAQAQAEINQFVAEQAARARTKKLIYGAIFLLIVAAGVFWWLRDARKQKRIKEIYTFFQKFRNVDDEDNASFWKCTVRAKHRDVRLAKDTLEITDGLTKAFNNFPKSQPDHLKDKCVPQIAGVIDELNKLKPPAGFAQPIDNVKKSMEKVRTVFMAYANRIDKRKATAGAEREVKAGATDFHTAYDSGEATEKALAYWNIINCAVPEIPAAVRKIKKGPDTQYIVEYIYENCVKKDVDPMALADKMRKECYDKRNEKVDKKDKHYKEALRYLSGDNRDLAAITACFKKANRGFDRSELEAVAKAFIEYNKARGSVLKALENVKKEMAQ